MFSLFFGIGCCCFSLVISIVVVFFNFKFFSSFSDCRVLDANDTLVVVLLVEMLVFEFRSESDVVFGEVNFSTLLAFAVVVDIDKRGFLLFLDKLLSRLLSFSLQRRGVAGVVVVVVAVVVVVVVKDGEDDEDESVVKLFRFKFFLALDVVLTVVDMFSFSLFDDKIADSLNPGIRFTSVLDLK